MTAYVRNGNGRVLVGGGRNYSDHKELYAILDHFWLALKFTALIEGGARGTWIMITLRAIFAVGSAIAVTQG